MVPGRPQVDLAKHRATEERQPGRSPDCAASVPRAHDTYAPREAAAAQGPAASTAARAAATAAASPGSSPQAAKDSRAVASTTATIKCSRAMAPLWRPGQ